MTHRTVRTSIAATALCLALAVSACVPIPYKSRTYVPNEADVTRTQSSGSGCGFGTDGLISGYREVGPVRITANVISVNDQSANPQAQLQFSFYQGPSPNTPQRVSVNPAKVKLQEGGRTLVARLESKDEAERPDGQRGDFVSVLFAAPSGVSDTLRVVFDPGAIRIGGRSVAFAPIRYTQNQSTSVYMFPCIPT